jgi:DNA-binding NarL/FixJ family response regulator
LRWLAPNSAGRGTVLRRSLGVKRWGARVRLAALRERLRLIDQMCVLGAMYPDNEASRASAAVRSERPRTPLSPALLKPDAFRGNNTVAAPGARPYRAARPLRPGAWSAPPRVSATPASFATAARSAPSTVPAWHRDEPLVCPLDDDTRPADSAATAGEVGAVFSSANEVELAFLMRLIADGDTATASRIARRIVAAKGSAQQFDLPAAAAAPSPRTACAAALPAEPEDARTLLSPRELKVLRMISQGLSNREIAEASYRSLHTVDAQVKNIYRKLAVKSRAQAVSEAMQSGLLSPEA